MTSAPMLAGLTAGMGRHLSWFVPLFAGLFVLVTWLAVGELLDQKRRDSLSAETRQDANLAASPDPRHPRVGRVHAARGVLGRGGPGARRAGAARGPAARRDDAGRGGRPAGLPPRQGHAGLAAASIVIMSARGTDQDLENGTQADCDAHLVKPFGPLQLMALIDLLRSADARPSRDADGDRD